MMKILMPIGLFVVVGGLVVLWSSAFVVSETEQVIITQFGKPHGEPITDAGLHWKTPFVQKIHRFEYIQMKSLVKRLLEVWVNCIWTSSLIE